MFQYFTADDEIKVTGSQRQTSGVSYYGSGMCAMVGCLCQTVANVQTDHLRAALGSPLGEPARSATKVKSSQTREIVREQFIEHNSQSPRKVIGIH
jgi:hypothetical protein